MSYGLLLGKDKEVAAWAHLTHRVFPMPYHMAIGVISSDGSIKGAILFQNFNGIDVNLSYYGYKTLTPGIIKSIARIVVTEFNAARLTVVTSKRNRRIRRALLNLGFSLEGQQRRYYGHRDCNKNTAVRFVVFYERLCEVAGIPCVPLDQKGFRPCYSPHHPATTQLQ